MDGPRFLKSLNLETRNPANPSMPKDMPSVPKELKRATIFIPEKNRWWNREKFFIIGQYNLYYMVIFHLRSLRWSSQGLLLTALVEGRG